MRSKGLIAQYHRMSFNSTIPYSSTETASIAADGYLKCAQIITDGMKWRENTWNDHQRVSNEIMGRPFGYGYQHIFTPVPSVFDRR